uniref:BED-type domain-containing protein n=1 Tax=Ditylenchus dipsaci TaxID=166011 RepID=A0A915DE57_9BILA
MSTNSDNSPSQASNFAKKRSRDAVWENFTEIEVLGEFKMKCNECQLIIARHKTALSNHWVKKHTDKEQPAKKICLSQNEGSGVTLHYCDASAILRRAFLGLQQLKRSHTGQLIRRETEKILAEYGLSLFEEFEGALEEEVEDVEDNMELTDIDFLLQ